MSGLEGQGPIAGKLKHVIKHLLPYGTREDAKDLTGKAHINENGKKIPLKYHTAPPVTDMFLVAGYLVKLSGVAPFINPADGHCESDNSSSMDGTHNGGIKIRQSVYADIHNTHQRTRGKLKAAAHSLKEYNEAFYRYLGITAELEKIKEKKNSPLNQEKLKDEMKKARDTASENMQTLGELLTKCDQIYRDVLSKYWAEFICHWNCAIGCADMSDNGIVSPTQEHWWQSAVEMMVICDSLCSGIGLPAGLEPASLPAFVVDNSDFLELAPARSTREHAIPTLAIFVPPEVACVLPKSAVPNVGCNIRSMSLNLTVLPSINSTGTIWDIWSVSGKNDRTPLNVLLIPIPYYLHADCFQPCNDTPDNRNWNYYEIDAKWHRDCSREDFIAFVYDLCKQATLEAGKVDAIIFPEMALSWDLYDDLVDAILTSREGDPFHEIEFVVSGLTDCEGRRGNYAGITSFIIGEDGTRGLLRAVQPKHHRWKLEDMQIETYRLQHILNKGMSWWEKLPASNRRLSCFRFRNTSTFMTLICEDLARIDPGQEVLRSIGPDLVIAILMDSAQIKERWPARYATVLADDPGSSVLTLTSYALVHRANEDRYHKHLMKNPDKPFEHTDSIGLWKDGLASASVPILLARDSEAVLITLANRQKPKSSLDGRISDGRPHWRWTLSDQRQIQRPVDQQKRGLAFGREFKKDNAGWSFVAE